MNLPAPVVLEHSSFFDAFFASSIAVSLLTLFLLFLLKGKHTFLRFGITSLRLLAILIIVRGFLPVELLAPTFPITQTIFSRKILPALRDLLLHPLWTAGAFVLTPMILLVALWLSVSFYCLFRKIRGYLQFQNSLLSLPEISDPETLEILQTVLDSLFPNKNIKTRLVQSHGFISPAIWGLCRPTIILPCILADNSKELSYGIPPGYTGEELSCIFSHELLHYKHRDFHLKFLLDLLLSFHWWNPLLTHCLAPAVTQAQELSVDEYQNHEPGRKNAVSGSALQDPAFPEKPYICRNRTDLRFRRSASQKSSPSKAPLYHRRSGKTAFRLEYRAVYSLIPIVLFLYF